MMVTSFGVVLDACVLVPISLCDTLLSLAGRRLYVPYWSSGILDEMERNACRFITQAGKPRETASAAARYRRSAMQSAFPGAEIQGYDALIPAMTNHEKDRHVLAAALRVHASLIVTANVCDFPSSALSPYQIEAKTPDDFLLDLLGFQEGLVVAVIRSMAAHKSRPPLTELEILQRIGKSAPNFAAAVLMLLEA